MPRVDSDEYRRFIQLVQLPAKGKMAEECWHWLGSERGGRSKKGRYGQFAYGGKNNYAHRFSYEAHYEEIPENYEVDHVCRNRKCVNPAHLRLLPRRANRRRTSQRKEVKWGEPGI
jgi:hypothetical protein